MRLRREFCESPTLVLHHTATHKTPRYTATHCKNTLQHTATEALRVSRVCWQKESREMCGVAGLLSAGAERRERLLYWQEHRKCLGSLMSGPDPLGALARTRDSSDALHALLTLSAPALSSLGTPEASRYFHSVGETAEKECFVYCQIGSCSPSLCR